MNHISLEEQEDAQPHYNSAGKALILVGSVNLLTSLYFMLKNDSLGFIDSEMMAFFGTLFILVGNWMLSVSNQHDSHTKS